MTNTTTNAQLAPAITTVVDTVTQVMERGTEIARVSFETYFAGVNAVIKQQEHFRDASRQWFSGIVTTEQEVSERLVAGAAWAWAERAEAIAELPALTVFSPHLITIMLEGGSA